MFENFGEKLTQKAGPFPVWVWGLILGGAFVAWYWMSGQGLATSTGTPDEGELTTEAPPSGDFSTVPVMPPSDGVQDESTNLEWSVQALNNVPAGTSLIAAQTAISKYLNGQTLTSAEGAIINAILGKIGPPPEGVSTPDVTPAPGTTPKPATNWNTKTTISAYKNTWFGNAYVITVRVSWVSGTGHTFAPRGFVETAIDGALVKRTRLLNGVAVRTLIVNKNAAQFKDKAFVVTAKFLPNTGTSEKASAATPHTARILNK